MTKPRIILVCLFCLTAISGWYWFKQKNPISIWSQLNDHQFVDVIVGATELKIEIVNTSVSITQGLSDRTELGSDGMLFILPNATIPTFWMKGMQFDLDLIWLKDHKIVEITKNVPKPTSQISLADLPRYQPKQPVDMVLEVKAGQVDFWGLKPGDLIKVSCTSTPRKWYDVNRLYDCPN